MSVKAVLVVTWACLIAGAAVASESQRLCTLHTRAELLRLQDEHRLHEEKSDVLIVTEVDVTNY